jgi:hypothetical protein
LTQRRIDVSVHDVAWQREVGVVRLSLGQLHTLQEDDILWVAFQPVVESLNMDVETQVRKLKSCSWAHLEQRLVQLAGDEQPRDMVVLDRQTFTMWLAAINENNVDEAKRLLLSAYQQEAANALNQSFREGWAINSRATNLQLTRLQGQAQILQTLRGVVHPDWLEAYGRIVGARALGVEPDLDPLTRPLTVDEFLEEQGVPAQVRAHLRTGFGKHLAALYRRRHGAEPGKVDRNIGGRITKVNGYTERHRPLFHQVWTTIRRDI